MNAQYDYTIYNYCLNQLKSAVKEEREWISDELDSLLCRGVPEEDLACTIIQALDGDNLDRLDLKFQCRRVLRSRNLLFNKTKRITEKARRLRLEGLPREDVATTLYPIMGDSEISQVMIRKVCAELGYTDPRFKNRR